jgi:hypothetical protein
MALSRPSTAATSVVVAEVLLDVLLVAVAVDLQVLGNKMNMFPSLVDLVPFPCFHLPATPPPPPPPSAARPHPQHGGPTGAQLDFWANSMRPDGL